MQRQGGNFLLQALLALALIVAFIPFFAQKLATREKDAQFYAITSQVEVAQTAARIYLRENLNSLNYNITKIAGNNFADTLEPYGLPLGFVPRTALGQNISLIIDKNDEGVLAYLELSGGNLSEIKRAELARRLGFYASHDEGKVYVVVPLDENFSDLVRRREKNPDENGFLTDLEMGGFGIEGADGVIARNGEFETLQSNTLSLFGTEDGRKIRSKIDTLNAAKTIFQSSGGETALSVTRGNLLADSVSARTISKFGDTGNLMTSDSSIYDFSMTAGRSSFTGPSNWDVSGNLVTDNIIFSVEMLEISSFINATRGQDVFISPEQLDYSMRSGIEVSNMRAANITLRDQTASSLLAGGSGAVILDIRPAGTSVLPDVMTDEIDNDQFVIIADPADESGNTVDCKSIIGSLGGRYEQKSLSQNIICQYVFWQRLEKRIDIKQCMLDGRGDCR